MAAKAYPPGIHVPSLTFFRDNARQDIDWEVQEAHMEFLITSGLHGSKSNIILPHISA
jgi:4-hydroxy-2-oxoglutarate aldolase